MAAMGPCRRSADTVSLKMEGVVVLDAELKELLRIVRRGVRSLLLEKRRRTPGLDTTTIAFKGGNAGG